MQHRKRKKKTGFFVFIIFFFIWLFVVIRDANTDDLVFIESMSLLSPTSNFELRLDVGSEKTFKNGKLGEFYSCLKSHRSIYELRSKKGLASSWLMIINDDLKLRLASSQNEAYRVSTELDNKRSSSYAINCSFDLLNNEKTGQ